eukprot:TRINITY_DN11073_c0_g1_i1.p1 TRINITY_DN11073_c0_g1~~TRINITY_DN11073_c0_g1_i1.p1  ORF type:complete len:224 (+),score=33.92 TRINITY_DN11073_c0_g1_i1:158-829(+)
MRSLAQRREAAQAEEEAPTSLIIQNIPSRATDVEIMTKLDSMGFYRLYNFFYLPGPAVLQCKNSRGMSSSRGYAFINFKSEAISRRFLQLCASGAVTIRSDYKVLRADPSRAQGVEELLECTSRARSKASPWVEDAEIGEMVPVRQDSFPSELRRVGSITKIVAARATTIEDNMEGDGVSPAAGLHAHEAHMAEDETQNQPMHIDIDYNYYAEVALPGVAFSI